MDKLITTKGIVGVVLSSMLGRIGNRTKFANSLVNKSLGCTSNMLPTHQFLKNSLLHSTLLKS